MSTITRKACVGLLLLLLPANMTMASDRKPLKDGLEADTVQQIQTIGQAVLTAKKKVEPDADMQNLRQRLTELQQKITSPADSSISITKASPASLQTKQQDGENDKVRTLLDKVRKQRFLVQAKNQTETGARTTMERSVTAKVAELENAVEEALNSNNDERAKKLSSLKDRLTVSNHPLTAQPDKVEKTPTISTIVHHRVPQQGGKRK